jgi:hypothetical protein
MAGQPPRCSTFKTSREPLRNRPELQLINSQIHGPFSFLNPTRASFTAAHHREDVDQEREKVDGQPDRKKAYGKEQPAADVSYKWTSRNNRKGRHALEVRPPIGNEPAKYLTPPSTASVREVMRGIGRMFTQYPVWDVSYLVATIFTLGSVVWVINAFFVFLPLVQPKTEFKNETLTGGGVTAFIGATIFEVGSFLLMAEAVNENSTGCFGWALETAIEEHLKEQGVTGRLLPATTECTHHHRNRKNLVGKGVNRVDAKSNGTTKGVANGSPDKTQRELDDDSHSWKWFPSWAELSDHYLHELGFLASLTQLLAASVFWISGFTALPGILNKLSPGLEDGIYWTPQVIGGTGFIISGFLFMIETQPKWYIPAPSVLGWHIGFWNLIGGIGFTLSPAFGYDTSSWAQYQAALSTFWGSWAFLIGSTIQWYESLSKNPVEVKKT